METWNFHGYIAIPLEEYGKVYIGSSSKTADEIENGEFVDAMLSILSIKRGSVEGNDSFLALCDEFKDLPASQIPKDVAKRMFGMFKDLIQSK